MQLTCLAPEKDPLGTMLTDYMAGDKTAFLTVASPMLEMSEIDGAHMFRTEPEMSPMERTALDLCQGRILDVGAGSGCHSLILQERGLDVTALDISPGCMAVLKHQGIRQRIFGSLFRLKPQKFDTLLMLMNGIGICGTIEGLNHFFRVLPDLLASGGRVLADSTDLAAMYGPMALAAEPGAPYYGETEFTMSYGRIQGDPFDWLYVDFATLAFYAEFHGFKCQKLAHGDAGKYLAQIY